MRTRLSPALGLQLKHKATCRGGGCLTRHSHYIRVRLGGLTIWRVQCTTSKAVFTVLPHFVLRYRQCGLPLPVYFLADEKHSRCLTDKVYLPTIVRGLVLWPLGYTKDANATACRQSYQNMAEDHTCKGVGECHPYREFEGMQPSR